MTERTSTAQQPGADGAGTPPRVRVERRRGVSPLRVIVERLADGVVVVGEDGRVRFANPAAERMFGRTALELAGTEFGFPLVAGETSEVDVLRRGAAPVTAELRAGDIDWEGEPARLVSLRDITDRKRAAERAAQLLQERAARREAEAASQAKSEFLAVMSHELRTPLNAVLGYADLLELGLAGPLTEQQRQQIGRIGASGRHLLGLVNEILDLARVETGRLEVQRERVRALPAAATAVTMVRPQAEARGLTLVEPGPGAEELTYVGDEDRVRQILVNLLSNAVKFTSPGGRVAVEVGASPTADGDARLRAGRGWVYFRVVDTGVGIAADQLDLVFAPFQQAETGHTRRHDGSGLGLTISRRLARLMGGDLTLRSALGVGSTFTVWLPAAEAGAEDIAASLADHAAGAPSVRGLADVGEALSRDLHAIVEALVARLRDEPSLPAAGLKFSTLADHTATLLADVATSLVVLEESAGEPSPIIGDSTEIQRLVAERHGAQRAPLGWTGAGLACEFAILREEVRRALRRANLALPEPVLAEAAAIAERFLEQAEHVSALALERALKK